MIALPCGIWWLVARVHIQLRWMVEWRREQEANLEKKKAVWRKLLMQRAERRRREKHVAVSEKDNKKHLV